MHYAVIMAEEQSVHIYSSTSFQNERTAIGALLLRNQRQRADWRAGAVFDLERGRYKNSAFWR